jgi:hypothetical protein
VAAGRDREGAVGAPELARVLDLEAGVAEALLGLGMVGCHDGRMTEGGSGVCLSEDQVDLGSVALQPADRATEHVGGGNLLEAEQAPELDRAVGLLRRHLERDVMEHRSKLTLTTQEPQAHRKKKCKKKHKRSAAAAKKKCKKKRR